MSDSFINLKANLDKIRGDLHSIEEIDNYFIRGSNSIVRKLSDTVSGADEIWDNHNEQISDAYRDLNQAELLLKQNKLDEASRLLNEAKYHAENARRLSKLYFGATVDGADNIANGLTAFGATALGTATGGIVGGLVVGGVSGITAGAISGGLHTAGISALVVSHGKEGEKTAEPIENAKVTVADPLKEVSPQATNVPPERYQLVAYAQAELKAWQNDREQSINPNIGNFLIDQEIRSEIDKNPTNAHVTQKYNALTEEWNKHARQYATLVQLSEKGVRSCV